MINILNIYIFSKELQRWQLESQNLLLYSSGIHGVEGFAGSAIQLSVLDQIKKQQPFSDYCIVFIHIITSSITSKGYNIFYNLFW